MASSRSTFQRFSSVISRFGFLCFQLVEQCLGTLVSAHPQPAIALEPLGGVGERLRHEPPWPPLCVPAAPYEAGALEDLQVLRDRGLADGERLRQLRDRRLPRGEPRQDRAPRGIGERGERRVEAPLVNNHMVIYKGRRPTSTPTRTQLRRTADSCAPARPGGISGPPVHR